MRHKSNFYRLRIVDNSQSNCYLIAFYSTTFVARTNVTMVSGMVIKNYKSVRLLSRLHLFNNKINTELRKLNR